MTSTITSFPRKVATAKRENGSAHFELVEIKCVDGSIIRRQYPRELFSRACDVERALLRDGAELGKPGPERRRIVERLLAQASPTTGILAAATGWRDDFGAFVLGNRIIMADGQSLTPPLFIEQEWGGKAVFEAVGTRAGWETQVAKPAAHSSRITCSLAAGLAACLLPFADHPSFGINFFGPSSCGKTTALRVTRTLFGTALQGSLATWNMTASGFEQEAARSNDLPLLVDELGAADTGQRGSSLASSPVAYVLGAGSGRTRHRAFADQHDGGGRDSWRTIAQSTNEQSLAWEAARARRERAEGELVRFIDVPATSGNRRTVVDQFPSEVTPKERRAFARRLVAELNQACALHAGHAMPAFVAWLIAHRQGLSDRVKQTMQQFLDQVGAESDSLIGARMARAFAVIYAGGILGIAAGVLPWSEAQVLSAVKKTFRAARNLVQDKEMLVREGRSRLWMLAKSKAVAWPDKPDRAAVVADAPAFRRKRQRDVEYAIVPAALDSFLPDKEQQRLVLEALRRDGRLRMNGEHMTRQPRVLGPKDRRRYYVLRRPLKVRSAEPVSKRPSKARR